VRGENLCHLYQRFSSGTSGERKLSQGGHTPEKPGILQGFSEHGILREFCATSGRNYNK